MGGNKKKEQQRRIQEAKEQRRVERQAKAEMRKKQRKQKGDRFKLSQDYIDYFYRFNQDLAALKVTLKDVGGDGNCLFRSVADQFDGN